MIDNGLCYVQLTFVEKRSGKTSHARKFLEFERLEFAEKLGCCSRSLPNSLVHYSLYICCSELHFDFFSYLFHCSYVFILLNSSVFQTIMTISSTSQKIFLLTRTSILEDIYQCIIIGCGPSFTRSIFRLLALRLFLQYVLGYTNHAAVIKEENASRTWQPLQR